MLNFRAMAHINNAKTEDTLNIGDSDSRITHEEKCILIKQESNELSKYITEHNLYHPKCDLILDLLVEIAQIQFLGFPIKEHLHNLNIIIRFVNDAYGNDTFYVLLTQKKIPIYQIALMTTPDKPNVRNSLTYIHSFLQSLPCARLFPHIDVEFSIQNGKIIMQIDSCDICIFEPFSIMDAAALDIIDIIENIDFKDKYCLSAKHKRQIP